MKDLELLLNKTSILLSSAVFIVGYIKIDLLKQNLSSSKCFNLLQNDGMTQLLATATRFTTDSAALSDQIFLKILPYNPYCDLLDAGSLLLDHCFVFVKL